MKRVFAVFGVFLGVSLLWAEPSIWRHAECGGVDEVKAYLDAGNQVDATDEKGWTLLHHAAYGASGKMIKFLLSKGADVNKKVAPNGYKHGPIVSDFAWEWQYFGMDSAGVTAYTPLHLALMNLRNTGSFSAVKELVDGGADITIPMQFNGFGPKKMVDSPMNVLEFVLTRFTYGMGGPDQIKAAKFLYAANAKLPKKQQMKTGKYMAKPEAYLIKDVQLAIFWMIRKK
ncbi:MAG: ankyrin repeat domain-containing protein [Brevinematales bacterium]|nr:ankyrin repeat domain-containing protein [Brevinematales bacterium]